MFEKTMAILHGCSRMPSNALDEVIPGVFISEVGPALDVAGLQARGVKYVVNCCEGTTRYHANTGRQYYPSAMEYLGIAAEDSVKFDLSVFFPVACK